MRELVYLNGQLLPADAAEVNIFDRALLYGEGLFETMRVYGGGPFAIGEHLDRLCGSAGELGFSLPCSPEEMYEGVLQTLDGNGIVEGYARLTVSGGGGDIRGEGGGGMVLVYAKEGLPYAAGLYERGARVVIAKERRQRETRLSRHKSTSYLANLMAWREASAEGAEEALFLTPDGEIAEGTRSNFFAVVGDVLLTPPLETNILPGIVRAKVLELARELKVRSVEESFSLAELAGAGEAFITSSLMELMPVAKVGDMVLSECPGAVTVRLLDAYRKLVYSWLYG